MFEITVNRIYTVRATSEMMIETMFAYDDNYDAHHQSRNFEKVITCKTNLNFEKFQIIVNRIYSVRAMSEMII